MFSNATEAQMWQDCNCYICAKYESESQTREKAKCKTAFDIDLGYVTGELPTRADKITEKNVCPFRSIANPASKGFCKKCEHYLFAESLWGKPINKGYCRKHKNKPGTMNESPKHCFEVHGCRFFKEAENEGN